MRTILSTIAVTLWGFKGLEELLNIHPVFVHFPIALFLTSIAFYLLGGILKREDWLHVGKWLLFVGTLSTLFTAWTGLQAARTVSHGGETHTILMLHQYLGLAILGLSVALSVWVGIARENLPRKGKTVFFAMLVLLGLLVVQTADLGGRMVFLNGVGVGRKSMLQELLSHGEYAHHDHSH